MNRGDQSAAGDAGNGSGSADGAGEAILAVEGAGPDWRTRARVVEFVVLFLVAPSLLAMWMRPSMIFPAIWSLAAVCLVVLLRDKGFDRRRLWNATGVRPRLRLILVQWGVASVLLAAGLWIVEPERLLDLPRRRPEIWLLVMIGYPVLSVYAQEVAFRAFFFHRYAGLFRSEWGLVAAGALVFGYAHIILQNWVAMGLSTVGGVLFGLTYLRTRSTLASCVEHALYGCFLFTIGWGHYLFGGSMLK